MRERVKAEPHEVLIRHLFAPALEAEAKSGFADIMRANIAHTLLLVQSGSISPPDARALLGLYREMRRQGSACLELDPRLEDLHFNVESYVIRQLGAEVGGKMHTGRSRNDLGATLARMRCRGALLGLVDRAIALRQTVLDRAEEWAEVVMPGYTHLQPAQPITLGFYLSGIADALGRDTARLEGAYERTNLSPLGAGALAGTGFPLDRAMGAKLLGFGGVVENALDAVASRDYAAELLAALAILGVTISRLAHDLYLWATDEFGLVELADEVSIVSSIMPQKKNPITLEHCKGKAALLLGSLVASLGAMRASPFSHVRDVNRESLVPLWDALSQAEAGMELMEVTVATLSIRRERMLDKAQSDFSTATELADALVRHHGLPFRAAHGIVATVVAQALEAGLRAVDIDREMVERAAEATLGRRLGILGKTVRQALDARENVMGKATLGSPHPREVERMIERGRALLASDAEWLAESRRRLAAAETAMEEMEKRGHHPDSASSG